MKAPMHKWSRTWIFQADPSEFDVVRAMDSHREDAWTVSRYRQLIKPEDVIYLAHSGPDAALVGWGEVTDQVFNGKPRKKSPKREIQPRVTVAYRARIKDPLTYIRLAAEDDLSGLNVLRNRQGANFRVTPVEALALHNLFSEAEVNPMPPEPPRLKDVDGYPALALFDYRYTGTPIQAINHAARLAAQRSGDPLIDLDLLLIATLRVALKAAPERDDTTALLRQVLDTEAESALMRAEADYGSSQSDPSADPAGAPPRTRAVPEVASTFVDLATLKLLHTARRTAIETSGRERIALRHLVAAFGVSEDSDVEKRMSALELSRSVLNEKFEDFIAKRFPDDDHDAWERVLRGPSAASVSDLLTLLNTDDPQGRDRLNIGGEVNAFASIIAARDAEPPLAIGLFGDWGSGKTFFMRKVHERLARIAQQAIQVSEDTPNLYCGSIVQIWFNAWHYVEANLWASLVDQIFRALKDFVSEDKFNNLVDELGLTEEQLKAINDRLKLAQKRTRAAKNQLTRLQNQRSKIKGKTKTLLRSELLTQDELESLRTELRALLPEVVSVFGLAGVDEQEESLKGNVEELLGVIGKAGLVAGRGHNLLRALANDTTLKAHIRIFLIVSGIILVVTLFAATLAPVWSGFAAVIAEVSAGIGIITRWARPRLQSASALLDRAEGVQQRIRERVRDAEARREEEIAALQAELDRLNSQILAAEKELGEARREQEEIEAERTASAPERLVRFITERAASQDYRKHLGLLALVRNDFDTLSRLMAAQRFEETRIDSIPAVERIVLYIDDLDRCPPERVVDVLQAIHLLLAFPLFIVIVGVDSRWVSRSLRRHYRTLLQQQEVIDSGVAGSQVDFSAASTQDYLEKIFQIPFWLRPIDAKGVRAMIRGVVAQAQTSTAAEVVPAVGESESPQRRPDADEIEIDIQSEDDEPGAMEKVNLSPTSLQLSIHELSFMDSLAGVVGRSPRSVKRFVNVYRLLKTSRPEARTASFLSGDREFRAVLVLLAVLVGHPRASRWFFERVVENSGSRLLEGLLEEDDKQTDIQVKLCTALRQFVKENPNENNIDVAQLVTWRSHVVRFGYQEWRD